MVSKRVKMRCDAGGYSRKWMKEMKGLFDGNLPSRINRFRCCRVFMRLLLLALNTFPSEVWGNSNGGCAVLVT